MTTPTGDDFNGKQKDDDKPHGKQQDDDKINGKQQVDDKINGKQQVDDKINGKQQVDDKINGKQQVDDKINGKQQDDNKFNGKQQVDDKSNGKQQDNDKFNGKQQDNDKSNGKYNDGDKLNGKPKDDVSDPKPKMDQKPNSKLVEIRKSAPIRYKRKLPKRRAGRNPCLCIFCVFVVVLVLLSVVGATVYLRYAKFAKNLKKKVPVPVKQNSTNELVTFDKLCRRAYYNQCVHKTEMSRLSCVSLSCSETLYLLFDRPGRPPNFEESVAEKQRRPINTNFAACGEGKWCMDKRCVDTSHPLYNQSEDEMPARWRDVEFSRDKWKCIGLSEDLFKKLASFKQCNKHVCATNSSGVVFRLQLRVCLNLRLGCKGKPYRLISCGRCDGYDDAQTLDRYKIDTCNDQPLSPEPIDMMNQFGNRNPCHFQCGAKQFVVPDGVSCGVVGRERTEAICFMGVCELAAASQSSMPLYRRDRLSGAS